MDLAPCCWSSKPAMVTKPLKSFNLAEFGRVTAEQGHCILGWTKLNAETGLIEL